MTYTLTAMHASIALLSLVGFFALAFATERYGEHLLGRLPATHWRTAARIFGAVLLAGALAISIDEQGSGVGITLWFAWMCVASLILVFAFPKWPWQPPVREKPVRPPKEDPTAPVIPHARRRVAGMLLATTVVVFVIALWRTAPQPLLRDDAIHGELGPWTFTLAETDRDAPEVEDMDTPMKAYRIRFCDSCDADIRQVFMKVNKPHSVRASGMAFEGARWERKVEMQLPLTVTADSELWLTVVAKDGTVRQASWKMAQVSPATVEWFEAQRKKHAGN